MSAQTIKLQTADGSIFVYKMEEIDKIEKISQAQNQSANNNGNYVAASEKPQNGKNPYPSFGYRGFAGIETGAGDGNDFEFGVNTTHGFQISPFYFVGAGLQVQLFDEDDLAVTPYVDANFSFLRKKVTPFVDVKFGYTSGDVNGVYNATSFGVRLKHCHLALGFELQNNTYEEHYYEYTEMCVSGFFSFTIDFGARR